MAISLRLVALLAMSAALAGRALATETQTYTYDELGRLIAVTSSGTINNNQKHSICYDAAGNRTQYKSDAAGSGLVCSNAAPPALSIANTSVTEGGVLAFTVTRQGDASGAVSANYASTSGTAISGSDFTPGSGVVTFAAGQTSATISVATTDDAIVESAETLSVTLSAPTGGAVLGTATATGTINDNDAPPANLAIGNASVTEGGTLAFTVTRSGTTTSAVSASYATTGGTAASGSDFTGATGTVSFAANQTSAVINVGTIDDAVIEPTETMSLGLSTPSGGAAITGATGTGSIADNDTVGIPSIAISDASGVEAQSLVFTVTLSAPSSSTVTVNYATAIGTAGTGDFIATSGVLTFAPGQTSKTISVVTRTDNKEELDEYFYVNLTVPANATIGDAQGMGTIFDDGLGGGGIGCGTGICP